jgi:hypothetical protein
MAKAAPIPASPQLKLDESSATTLLTGSEGVGPAWTLMGA